MATTANVSKTPDRAPTLVVGATLAALMLLHALPYAGGAVLSDTARDLDAAWDIVEGARPWLGPLINGTLHLGPAWFYLLALPLGLSGSVAVTLLAVGLLAALKFPLAFVLGRRLHDARLGLLWALALALPGWPAMGQLLASHFVLVETATLAVLYALVRLAQRAPPRWWLAYGLLQSLALHAHPATLLLALLLPVVLLRRRGLGRVGESAWIGAGLVAAVLPFLPMLAHEAANDWGGFAQLRAYGGQHHPWAAMSGAPALLAGVVLRGPLLLRDALCATAAALPVLLLHGALVAAAAAGWLLSLRAPPARVRVARAAAVALLMLLGLAALRERTPWYMALAWQPWYALLLALGWHAVALRHRTAIAATGAAAVALAAAACGAWLAAGESGRLLLRPQTLLDVRSAGTRTPASFLPAWRLDRLGRRLCAPGPLVVLHGDVALAYDSALALPGRMRCGSAHRVGIGGGAALDGADHRLGFAPWMLATLGAAEPMGWSAALRLKPTAVIAAQDTVPVARGEHALFRPREHGASVRQRLRFTAAAGAVVVVNRPFFSYDVTTVLRAVADGRPQQPVHARVAMLAYRCAACTGETVAWELVLENAMSDGTDVFVFDPARVRTAP